jgi:hypothetical protein
MCDTNGNWEMNGREQAPDFSHTYAKNLLITSDPGW